MNVVLSHLPYAAKLKTLLALGKPGLSSMVVFSGFVGAFILIPIGYSTINLLIFLICSASITMAANALNQIIERDIDGLMYRTRNRPLPLGLCQPWEAYIFVGLLASLGGFGLYFFFNALTAFLSLLSLVIYALVYTPLKRVSSLAVLVGALPGALPPLIGAVAITGEFHPVGIVLFMIQFFWQFPHFWAIAWVSYDDYKRADIMLLPNVSGRTRLSAMHIVLYTLVLIPLPVFAYYMSLLPMSITLGLVALGTFYTLFALVLFMKPSTANARKLMFASFIYLPVGLALFILNVVV
ncbi:MAG: protoheme IX farnesyltransferase [Saprospirales bacterium]|nr:protoheme IX farnesyltransferase [Saprospirales bacterium]|tara:strand:+ start:3305 stop:4192 length:888 start_codon:yes stop_codon:yes gene_type:complete